MVHKAEDEAASRKMFEEQPAVFAQKVLDLKMKGATSLEGEEHQGDAQFESGPGAWDAKNKTFKELS
jgi:hypothetical protein